MTELMLPEKYQSLDASTITPKIALEILELEINQLKAVEFTAYKTSGISTSFKIGGKDFNLRTATNPGAITAFYSSILGKEYWYNKAQLELSEGQPVPEFLYDGYPKADWLHDGKLRLLHIRHKPLLKEKEAEYATLSAFISEKDREQTAIANFIKNRTKQ